MGLEGNNGPYKRMVKAVCCKTAQFCATRRESDFPRHLGSATLRKDDRKNITAARQRTLADFSAFVMHSVYAFCRLPLIHQGSDPNGIRTRVTAVKGRCPGPLDDRVILELPDVQYRNCHSWRKANRQQSGVRGHVPRFKSGSAVAGSPHPTD